MVGFKLKPSDAVWQTVDAQLKEDRKRRRWVIFFLFAGLLLGGGGLLYISSNKDESRLTARPEASAKNTNTNSESAAVTNTTTNTITTTVNKEQRENTVSETKAETKTTAATIIQPNESKQQQAVVTEQIKSKGKSVAATKPAIQLTVVKNKQQKKPIALKEDIVITSAETKDEIIIVDTTVVIDTKTETTTTISTKDSAAYAAADSILQTANRTPVDSSVQPKNKWRVGLHVNAGIAQIRESVFPGVMLSSADASPLFGNNGGSGGPTSITVNQFTVKPGVQFGAGVVVRKTIFKKHAFVTGLQYQYSSYKVQQTQRVDSFYQVTNSFSTVMVTESNAVFRTHNIAVPLDVEWKIAATSNGMFRLGTGLQQWFSLSSVKNGTVASSFRYSGATSTSGGTATAEKTTWQPVLQIAPLYEWSTKKQTSQLGLFFNYGLRPVYKTTASDYWWQTGMRYRFYFKK